MISIIIPIYNAEAYLPTLLKSLKEQTQPYELVLIDSGSTDGTGEILQQYGIAPVYIKQAEFNHGATRNLGMQLATTETLLYMTQDALPASSQTVERLVKALYNSPDIAMAYGRQLPYPNSGPFGRFARLINYPAESLVKTKANIPEMGIKTCSCSNSFAIYRKADLMSVEGFPTNTILGEDVSVAARLILQGKGVAYCAESEVYHSHDYTLIEEFKRYFDIGVFHTEQQEVLKEFKRAESEGLKYVAQEWKYLKHNGELGLIPAQVTRTLAKYLGYRLGRNERKLPKFVKPHLSMHRSFWQ